MPKLFERRGEAVLLVTDAFVNLEDGDSVPAMEQASGVVLSLLRFQNEGETLLGEGRSVGVRLEPDEPVESLTYDLPRLAMVALCFPKFRDGRPYTAATLLRERFGFKGQVRAVGDVLRDQAQFMIRCGFDAFEPADDSAPDDFARAARLFHHVYQSGADGRVPAFEERAQRQCKES